MLNFCKENCKKSQMKAKVIANRNKNEEEVVVVVEEGEKSVRERKSLSQLATEAPFCDIKSILFVRARIHIQTAFSSFFLPCRKFPRNTDNMNQSSAHANRWKPDFHFPFETTDNLETHFFPCTKIRNIFFVRLDFFKLSKSKMMRKKQNNEISHQTQ